MRASVLEGKEVLWFLVWWEEPKLWLWRQVLSESTGYRKILPEKNEILEDDKIIRYWEDYLGYI